MKKLSFIKIFIINALLPLKWFFPELVITLCLSHGNPCPLVKNWDNKLTQNFLVQSSAVVEEPPNQTHGATDEPLLMCVAWQCPDVEQISFCWSNLGSKPLQIRVSLNELTWQKVIQQNGYIRPSLYK